MGDVKKDLTILPLGTREIKDVLDLVLGIIDVGLQAMKDGKVGVEDMVYLMSLLPKLAPALDGIEKVPAELNDLTTEESADLVAHIMAGFSLKDVHAKDIVQKGLKVAVGLYDLYKTIKNPI